MNKLILGQKNNILQNCISFTVYTANYYTHTLVSRIVILDFRNVFLFHHHSDVHLSFLHFHHIYSSTSSVPLHVKAHVYSLHFSRRIAMPHEPTISYDFPFLFASKGRKSKLYSILLIY